MSFLVHRQSSCNRLWSFYNGSKIIDNGSLWLHIFLFILPHFGAILFFKDLEILLARQYWTCSDMHTSSCSCYNGRILASSLVRTSILPGQVLSHWCEAHSGYDRAAANAHALECASTVIPMGRNNSSAAERYGEAWPNWQVGALSSVLIKPGFFLRKRLILRQAGEHVAAGCGQGLHSEGTCRSSNLTRLSLWLRTWQTHGYLTSGRRLPTPALFALTASQPAGSRVAPLQCEWPVYTACVRGIPMATKSPGLPLGTGRKKAVDRGSFVSVWLKYWLHVVSTHWRQLHQLPFPLGCSIE